MPAGRRAIVWFGVAVASLLGACDATAEVAGRDNRPATSTITVATFQFGPDPLVVSAGTTVTFVNKDAIDHTVTAGTRDNPSGLFHGELAEKGATFDLALDQPGTYPYFCEIHPGPGMTGEIRVEPT